MQHWFKISTMQGAATTGLLDPSTTKGVLIKSNSHPSLAPQASGYTNQYYIPSPHMVREWIEIIFGPNNDGNPRNRIFQSKPRQTHLLHSVMDFLFKSSRIVHICPLWIIGEGCEPEQLLTWDFEKKEGHSIVKNGSPWAFSHYRPRG